MKASDEAMTRLVDALAAEFGAAAAADFKVEADCLMRRYRKDYQRRIADAEVAALLPQGWRAVIERYGGSKSGVYLRNKRHAERNVVQQKSGQVDSAAENP